MVEPHSSNFRVITTNILGVRIFRKFMVFKALHTQENFGKGLSYDAAQLHSCIVTTRFECHKNMKIYMAKKLLL